MKKGIKTLLAKLAVNFPVAVVKARYFMRFGRIPRLNPPVDLNEKILYLKLYGDTSSWTTLADKYLVRDYVSSCGFKMNLIPLIGVWDKVSDIPFESLSEKCMLKANNGDGKGTNMLFIKEEANGVELERLKKVLQGWLEANNIGALSAEPQYRDIHPRIIAEKYLEPLPGEPSLIDYKIWCFNGKPYSILCCSNREKDGHLQLGCYDLQWNLHSEYMRKTKHHAIQQRPLDRPQCLEQMIAMAAALSKPFPEVRVDLYQYGDQVYFGELTFTSLGGMMNYYTDEYLEEMGAQIKLATI